MPSLLVIKKLAAALDTTMADLMRELEQGEPTKASDRGKRGGKKATGAD
jgi:hypothetical protein